MSHGPCVNYCQDVTPQAPATHQQLGVGEPDGTVFVFLDESFSPLVAASAVVVEASDVLRMNNDIGLAFEEMRSWYRLEGTPSFDEFRARGFHATGDPHEVQLAFVGFLAEVLNFKTLIFYSDRSSRPEVSDKQRLMVIFDRLVRDVLKAYRSRPKVVFYFESAQEMDRYAERVVHRAVKSLGRRKPEIEVRFGTKRSPDLLAVPDYVLHIFNRWRVTPSGKALQLEPAEFQSRSLRAILGSISSARSLESEDVIRRTLPQPSS